MQIVISPLELCPFWQVQSQLSLDDAEGLIMVGPTNDHSDFLALGGHLLQINLNQRDLTKQR
jgi:hypothetical protein